MKFLSYKSIIIFIIGFFISIIASFVLFQLVTFAKNEKRLSQEQIIQEAKAHFQGIIDTRSWNATYGGVFVKQTHGLQPNEYLKNNTLKTDTNETLIKINPAWMTRQISEISNKQSKYQFKITSLKPLNPSNKADKFETTALNYFEQNKDEKYFYNFNDKTKNFNFMGALVTNESCLQCHEHQGYKIGDIRGGIRVSIPLALYNERMSLLKEKTKNSFLIVFIVSIILLSISYWFVSLIFKRKHEIENAKEILEEKVSKRTRELEIVVSHEQHLIDVLKTISEVNKMLITSYSIHSILKNATHQLATNDSYSLVLSGLIHDDILEITSKSATQKDLITQDIISLEDDKNTNFLFKTIKKAVKLKHSIIEKISTESKEHRFLRREGDLGLNWMIVLPLMQDFESEVYGMITVFCSREDGFEVEEMHILEKMAQDISVSLYSQKQRDSILEMEKEKTANYEETILAFVNIIEQRDTYTAGHTLRVADYCSTIAKEMKFSDEDIRRLEKAAILHDIGKVATPDTILLKPGKLSHLEYELIKQHSEIGAEMLEKISIYKDLANIIRYHHSRYDGKGYPRTSSPDEIPMLSHIMIVADAFDAMTTNRIYRPRKNIEEALEELRAGNKAQFHPDVVKAAIASLKEVNVKETSQMPTSELERRRMSYFFHDSLTELYNEDYLLTILNTPHHKYRCLHILDLKKFTNYNKTYGWEEGNKFLIGFAEFLTKSFPDDIIIRYHGDNFVIASKENYTITAQDISTYKSLKDTKVDIKLTHHNIDQFFKFEDFKNL